MTVTIYNSSADERILDKSNYLKTVRAVVNADIKGACSVERPTLILDYSTVDFNYVYIPAFTRYYYVTDIVVTTGDRVIISCQCDVLNTYKESIRALQCYLSRTEKEDFRDKMSIDNLMPVSADVKYEAIPGEQILGMGHYTYVLGVI